MGLNSDTQGFGLLGLFLAIVLAPDTIDLSTDYGPFGPQPDRRHALIERD